MLVGALATPVVQELLTSVKSWWAEPGAIVHTGDDSIEITGQDPSVWISGQCNAPAPRSDGVKFVVVPCADPVLVNLGVPGATLWNFEVRFKIRVTPDLQKVTWVARADDGGTRFYVFTLALPTGSDAGIFSYGLEPYSGVPPRELPMYDDPQMRKRIPPGHNILVTFSGSGNRFNVQIDLTYVPGSDRHRGVGRPQFTPDLIFQGNPYKWGRFGFVAEDALHVQELLIAGRGS